MSINRVFHGKILDELEDAGPLRCTGQFSRTGPNPFPARQGIIHEMICPSASTAAAVLICMGMGLDFSGNGKCMNSMFQRPDVPAFRNSRLFINTDCAGRE